jgi:hypothetical protein
MEQQQETQQETQQSISEKNAVYSSEIKTTISCPTSICDVNGNVLPNGNYYFTIHTHNDEYCKGSLTAKGQYGEFTFKTIDIIKMMSIAQSRLARRSGLQEDGMPDYISPPISPENSNLTKQLDEKEVIHNYFYTPDQCSICLSMISKNRKRLVCNHSFHNLCISKWLARDQRCPVCRCIHVERPRRRQTVGVDMDVDNDGERDVSHTTMNLRRRYNNYVIPRNNYVNDHTYIRRNTTENKYTYKK